MSRAPKGERIADKIIGCWEGPSGFWPLVRTLQWHEVEVAVNQLRGHLIRLERAGLLVRTVVTAATYRSLRQVEPVWSLTPAGLARQRAVWDARRAARDREVGP